jgi:hypothetical protein
MPALVKFNKFVRDLGLKVHNLDADTLKVYLSNATPDVSAHVVRADIAEITAANGYTAGGYDAQASWSESSGTATLVCTDLTITAAGGSVGPFRYAIFYNDTPTSPVDPLIGYWDYGSSITLADGENVKIDFAASTMTLA